MAKQTESKSKPKSKKVKLAAQQDALNWSLVVGAIAAGVAGPVSILAAGGVVTAGMWAGAGLSTLLGLAAGNVKVGGDKHDGKHPDCE
jgi:hypothetical protein